jgi:uncharacterized protein (TIGR03435 family)
MLKRLCLVCLTVAGLHAQSFDVASIRPHAPDDSRSLVRMPNGGHFTAEGAVVKLLVMLGYGVQDSQIAGGPSWFGTEKWDIEAKCDDTRHSPEETQRMLQKLLEDRFSLKMHTEKQQRPVYLLTVANKGPKFTESNKATANLRVNANSISIERGNMNRLTGVLATALGRPVLDRTGLTGLYDLSVQWDDAPVREGGAPGIDVPPAPGDDHGSIFTAVENQLGLHLERQHAPVDVLVIDHIDKPSSN